MQKVRGDGDEKGAPIPSLQSANPTIKPTIYRLQVARILKQIQAQRVVTNNGIEHDINTGDLRPLGFI